MKCSNCPRTYRVGGGLVYVLDENGSLQRRRVCQVCAKLAVGILLPKVTVTCACGQVATLCLSCAKKERPVKPKVRRVSRQFSFEEDAKK